MTYLEITDRSNGETKRISMEDRQAIDSIQDAADFNGMKAKEAMKILQEGGTIETFGFFRRLVKEVAGQ